MVLAVIALVLLLELNTSISTGNSISIRISIIGVWRMITVYALLLEKQSLKFYTHNVKACSTFATGGIPPLISEV